VDGSVGFISLLLWVTIDRTLQAGFMGFFKKIYGKENTSAKKLSGNPLDIIILCMKDISDQLLIHFNKECYKWNVSTGIKLFECLILSKFFLDHSLVTSFHEKLDETRLKFYLEIYFFQKPGI
jgi:hypothetical protein